MPLSNCKTCTSGSRSSWRKKSRRICPVTCGRSFASIGVSLRQRASRQKTRRIGKVIEEGMGCMFTTGSKDSRTSVVIQSFFKILHFSFKFNPLKFSHTKEAGGVHPDYLAVIEERHKNKKIGKIQNLGILESCKNKKTDRLTQLS